MDPYDSDSSFEDEDVTDTGVLLGYGTEDIIEDTVSHLGGWPTWLDDATPPPGDFANCKVCNNPMALLLELNGDLPEHFPNDERRLYLFGCPRKACTRKPGSIRALRATRKLKADAPGEQTTQGKPHPEQPTEPSKEEQSTAPKQDLGTSLFGGSSLTGSVSTNSNPFSSSSNASAAQASSNPFATPSTGPSPSSTKQTPGPSNPNALAETFADKVKISSSSSSVPTTALTQPPEATRPSKPWPAQSAFPQPHPQFYLDAEYETISRPPTPTIPENVTIETADDDDSKPGSGDLKDAFESEMDKAFLRFSTRLAHNPEQALRYQFRGTPLLYSYTDALGKKLHELHAGTAAAAPRVTTATGDGSVVSRVIPRCEYCGRERVFELQLVPYAISLLEEGKSIGFGPEDAGMDWGTIILGVCARDCGPELVGVTGWREEWVGVQWEESK